MAKPPRAKAPSARKKSFSEENLLIEDCGERIALMDPMRIGEDSRWRSEISELAVDLTYKAAEFKASLPKGIQVALCELVRNMNCYYSNLIEGHHTHPIAIERALNEVYDADPEKRNLQLEAKAHIAVQRFIDEGNLPSSPTSESSILEIHRRFVECLPEELRWVEIPKTNQKLPVIPGEYREHHVQVGNLVAISPGAVPRFMRRYEEAYANLGRAETIIACAAAHHRLTWIHPFLDGNGRVVRLVSHAMMRNALDTGGVWSIARGLARNVDKYKALLSECDLPRRNDLDGRGTLSEEALINFTKFFLATCIDQIDYMSDLMQPDRLRARVLTWADEEARLGSFSKSATLVMEAVLFRGELPRGDIASLIHGSDRTASRLASQLNSFGVLTSSSPRAPLRLALPATLAHRWFPGLYPAK
ncbi:Fic family protein [Rhodomicrobium lacus]|uniref:Fic family protein n=1 Tax=Rhodomicrobium lacus TaxID=2498452 RepID=UPI001AEC8888|nr:Fic family protein [Rhodomicrobium lacus]